MKSEKKKWDKKLELVENQLAKIKDVLRKIDDALRFYYNEATDEIKEQLKDPLNWNHTQLDYYKAIDAYHHFENSLSLYNDYSFLCVTIQEGGS